MTDDQDSATPSDLDALLDDDQPEVAPPESLPPRPRKWLKRFLKLVLLILFLVCFTLITGISVLNYIREPRPAGPISVFEVPKGATGNEIAVLLAQSELVDHEIFFRMAMRLEPSNESIKYGRYELPNGVSPVQLLEILREGPEVGISPDAIKVTIPEGLTLRQMGELFDEPDRFINAVADLDPEAELGFVAPSFEGFLMPNTYFFEEEPTSSDLVARMLEQFNTEFAKLLVEFGKPDLDPVALVTLASLVEEEARVDEERALIAAVMYNRLKAGRALEMDSTLQYALGKYGERLLNEDKQVDSPYNTYKYPGLPPGPISNPGVASLRAAFAPADVKYLYFVSNADGKTHTFSNNLAEHNEAVARYRREIRKQRREERNNNQ